MNKKSKSMIAVYGVLVLIYLIAFVVIPFPKNAASWISFVFTLISLAVSFGIISSVLKKEGDLKSKFYGFPILKIGYLYPIVQLILGIVICGIVAFVAVPYWIALVLSLVLLAVAIIGVIAADNVRDIIEENEAQIERTTKATKLFNLNISSALDLCAEPTVKKELEKLAEAFRFSDPVSNEATEEIENIIMGKLEKLKIQITSSSSDENIEKITELKNLLLERNRICKATK